MDEAALKDKVESVLAQKENPLDLRVASLHCVDGRWWVFLEIGHEPEHRREVWEALAEIEQRLDDEEIPVTVAAA